MTSRVWALVLVGAGFVWAEGCGGDTNGALFNGRGGNANAGTGGADAGETGGTSETGGTDSVECKNSLDCVKAPAGRTVCDRTAGMCVECVADADCDAPTRCYAGHCRATCTSDKDCTQQGLLCDKQAGHCVECVVDGDCALRMTCVAGSCESPSPPGTGGTVASGGRAGSPAVDGGATGRGGSSTGGDRNSGGSLNTGGGTSTGGGANTGGSTNTGGTLPMGGAAGTAGAGTGGAPPASCTNGKKDNAETDVDCGGATCPPCPSGRVCKVGADCTSKSCATGTCAEPSCSDGIRNGAETSVDCGGGCLCRVNATCTMPSDCASGACSVNSNGQTGTCKPALTCSNGTRDGTETGIDCGGPGCNKCGATGGCNSNIDCASFVCEGKVCAQCDAMKCPVPVIPLSTACCIANAGCGMSIAGTPCL